MFLCQKQKGGVFYIVENVKIIQPDRSIKYKKVWKTTQLYERSAAEMVLAEIKASRNLTKAKDNQRKLRNLIIDRATAVSETLQQTKTTFDLAWRLYQDHPRTREMRSSSVHIARCLWRKWSNWIQDVYPGINDIEQIDTEQAQHFIDDLRAQNQADATVKRAHVMLKGMYKRIGQTLKLTYNPFDGVITMRHVTRKERRCFTQEEIERLLVELSPEWQLLVLLALYAGLRFGDCCCLVKEAIIDNKYLDITPRKTESSSGKKVLIPIHPSLMFRLLEAADKVESGFVLPEFAGRYLKRSSRFCCYFGKILDRLGMRNPNDKYILDFHCLRHTFNTRLAEAGVGSDIRMKLTGHSSIKMNQVYNHAVQPLVEAIHSLPELTVDHCSNVT
mgnify:CR=1 FL=1